MGGVAFAAMSHSSFAAPSCRRVFCVDDDPVSQRLLTMALARPGWSVECARSGQEALERFAGDVKGFDVLVTDHVMPGMDGVELVSRLREIGYRGEVVVVTAGMSESDAAHYRALNAGFVLLKPLEVRRLRAAVTAALHSSIPEESQPEGFVFTAWPFGSGGGASPPPTAQVG